MALGIPREASDALRDLSSMKDELVRMRRSLKDIRDLIDQQNMILSQLIRRDTVDDDSMEDLPDE